MVTPILIGAIAVPIAGAIVLSVMSRQTPESIGLVDGMLAPCPASPNCVSSLAERPDQHVDAIQIGESVDVIDLIQRVIANLGGAVISTNENYVHAVFSSPVFRFKDDVEFLIVPDKAVIEIRSASRVGRSDLGANRRRVDHIRRMIRTEL